MIGSKQELAVLLSKLKAFENPDPALEQYPTDSEVAAQVLWEAHMKGDIEHRTITDFGCGTGVLGIGALALGAKSVVFIEIDPRVFPTLMENIYLLEQETSEKYSNYQIIQGNIEAYDVPSQVILQNPPFGTKKEHADIPFLHKAIELAPVVYTMHKLSTESFLVERVNELGGRVTDRYELKFPLKNTMPQHTRDIERIDVVCLRIES